MLWLRHQQLNRKAPGPKSIAIISRLSWQRITYRVNGNFIIIAYIMYDSDCCTKEPTVCFAIVMVHYLCIKVILVITIYVTKAVCRHVL